MEIIKQNKKDLSFFPKEKIWVKKDGDFDVYITVFVKNKYILADNAYVINTKTNEICPDNPKLVTFSYYDKDLNFHPEGIDEEDCYEIRYNE